MKFTFGSLKFNSFDFEIPSSKIPGNQCQTLSALYDPFKQQLKGKNKKGGQAWGIFTELVK